MIALVEPEKAKGGLTLDQSKAECSDELRSGVFMRHARGAEGGPTGLVPREVIAWLRVREFQLLSLRMICHELLLASPLLPPLATLWTAIRSTAPLSTQ